MNLWLIFASCAAASIQEDASIASSVAQSVANQLQSFSSAQGIVSAYFVVRGFQPLYSAVKQLRSDLDNSNTAQSLERRDTTSDIESLGQAESAIANTLGNLADKANDFIALNLGSEMKVEVSLLYPEIAAIASNVYSTANCNDALSLASGISSLDASLGRAATLFSGTSSSITARASCDATSSNSGTSTSTSSTLPTTTSLSTTESSITNTSAPATTTNTTSTGSIIATTVTAGPTTNGTYQNGTSPSSTTSITSDISTSIITTNTTVVPINVTSGQLTTYPGTIQVTTSSASTSPTSTSLITSTPPSPDTSPYRPTSKAVFTTVRCRVRPTGLERPSISSVIIS